MNELMNIEQEVKKITEQTIKILEGNFPLDSREFLEKKELEIVRKNDNEIVALAQRYLEAYKKMPLEDQRKYRYQNIQGEYYQATHKIKGLIKAQSNDDEFELREAFQRATKFGMYALDTLCIADKTNDEQMRQRGQLILDKCKGVLGVHYWGESRIEYLDRYAKRLEQGRTVEEDLEEYKLLVQETKLLSIEYAKAILNGISEAEVKVFRSKFEDCFAREIILTEFIPREILSEIKVNLHWMKVDAERKPEVVIAEVQQITNDIKRK